MPCAIIAKHYCIAAVWADCPEGTRPRVTKQAYAAAIDIANQFLAMLTPEQKQGIESAYANGYGAHPDCGNVSPWWAAVGHDLYMTRAGHGVGFQDRDALPETLRRELKNLCGWNNPMGEAEVSFYRGWLYIDR